MLPRRVIVKVAGLRKHLVFNDLHPPTFGLCKWLIINYLHRPATLSLKYSSKKKASFLGWLGMILARLRLA